MNVTPERATRLEALINWAFYAGMSAGVAAALWVCGRYDGSLVASACTYGCTLGARAAYRRLKAAAA